jgi:dipeptidyl aminopeptidase/acylaminoacyl peptidase
MTDDQLRSLPPLIPREVIFGNPTKEHPQISPDGKLMAYLAPVDDVLNVWVGDIEKEEYRAVTHDRDRGVRIYFWAFDNKTILYLQDIGGDENWRMYSTDLETGETTELTPYDNMQVQVIAYEKHRPNEMIIAMNKDDPALHDAYHLDLPTGKITLVAKNPGNVAGWMVDADLKLRAALASTPDAGFELLIRDSEEAPWRPLVTWDAENSLSSAPLGFTRDGRAVYLHDSRNANAARLVKLDIGTGDIEVLAEDPIYDAGSTMENPDTYEIEAVSFVRARQEWVVLDESIADDMKAIRKLNPGDFAVYDRTAADDIWLIGFTQDTGPVSYYQFDRQSKKGRFLFHTRPKLADADLAPMEPVSFTARDGREIHGYLTRPSGLEEKKNLPLVLNVHGGPWHRDTWGYNPEAQWFANRGYACLQVNFRGSTGYGKEFLNAGDREWGAAMHDDLVDAVNWAVEQGIADSKRIAIYGGSYGGYAALVGATFTPDLFTCAVDIVGPSNLITFINSIPPYWSAFLKMLHNRVGDPESDADFLKSRSPLCRVDQIKIPMLIAQGANDPRVKQAESEQVVAAMKEKGIDHVYMLFPDEGHGFAKPENRLKFYAAAEEFLAKHLGGRREK